MTHVELVPSLYGVEHELQVLEVEQRRQLFMQGRQKREELGYVVSGQLRRHLPWKL